MREPSAHSFNALRAEREFLQLVIDGNFSAALQKSEQMLITIGFMCYSLGAERVIYCQRRRVASPGARPPNYPRDTNVAQSVCSRASPAHTTTI